MNGRNYGEPDFKYVWDKIKTGSVDTAALTNEINQAVERAIASHGGTGTTDYNQLTNKPSIKGVTLTGNKSFSELGLYELEDDEDAVDLQRITSADIVNLINTVVNV